MSTRRTEVRRARSRVVAAVMTVVMALVLVAAAIADRVANGGGAGAPVRAAASSGASHREQDPRSSGSGAHAHAGTSSTRADSADIPSHATTTTTAPAVTLVAGPGRPALGVYTGGGNVAEAEQLAAGLPFPYALDYLPGDSWQTIADPAWTLARWQGTRFSMIWGVPMLPNTGGTLASGAAGDYNPVYYALGQQLVAAGQADAVLMIGYDPTATANPWAVTTAQQAKQYVEYWRQIVTALRSVPGSGFRFEWDVAGGRATVPPAALYPGDPYVDIVATDAFDIPAPGGGGGWGAQAAAPDGPDWLASFAARHGKELMIAKWGLVPKADGGGGDDIAFVSQFLTWCARHRVVAAVLWDDGAWGLTGGGFPAADAAFATLEQSGGHAAGT